MSMGATMSILGLWNNDHSIFDLMQLPDGFTTEDRETVTDSILTECAELEVLYPAPAVMKNVIGIENLFFLMKTIYIGIWMSSLFT